MNQRLWCHRCALNVRPLDHNVVTQYCSICGMFLVDDKFPEATPLKPVMMARYVAVATENGYIRVYDLETEFTLYTINIADIVASVEGDRSSSAVKCVKFSPFGETLFVSAENGLFRILFNDGYPAWLWNIRPNDDKGLPISDIYMNYKNYEAISCDGSHIKFWNAKQGVLRFFGRSLELETRGSCIDYKRPQTRLVSGNMNGEIQVWDTSVLRDFSLHPHPIATLFLEQGQKAPVTSIAIDQDLRNPRKWICAIDASGNFYSMELVKRGINETRAQWSFRDKEVLDLHHCMTTLDMGCIGHPIRCFFTAPYDEYNLNTRPAYALIICSRGFGAYCPRSQNFLWRHQLADDITITSCTYEGAELILGTNDGRVLFYTIENGPEGENYVVRYTRYLHIGNGSPISCMASWGPALAGDGDHGSGCGGPRAGGFLGRVVPRIKRRCTLRGGSFSYGGSSFHRRRRSKSL